MCCTVAPALPLSLANWLTLLSVHLFVTKTHPLRELRFIWIYILYFIKSLSSHSLVSGGLTEPYVAPIWKQQAVTFTEQRRIETGNKFKCQNAVSLGKIPAALLTLGPRIVLRHLIRLSLNSGLYSIRFKNKTVNK